MKDQKFTKGPWSANGLYISSPGKTSDIGQAFVKHNWDQLRGQKVEDVEANANALLIASAPKLASKLTALIEWLGKDWDGDSMVEECKELLAEAGCPFEYDEEEEND